MKTHGATINHLFGDEGRRPLHLTSKTEIRVFFGARNSRSRRMQAREHFLGIIADRRDDTHSGDNDAPHAALLDPCARLDAATLSRIRFGGAEQSYSQVCNIVDTAPVGL